MICGVAEKYLANIYVDNWFCKSDFLLLGPIIMQIWDPVCKGKGLGSIHFQIDDVIKSRSSPTSVGPLPCHSVTFASTSKRENTSI